METTLPKNLEEFKDFILSCIDQDYLTDAGFKSLYDCIEAEKYYKNRFSQGVVKDWLQGLPSACTVPFKDYDINLILQSIGATHWTIDNYWTNCAAIINNRALKTKGSNCHVD